MILKWHNIYFLQTLRTSLLDRLTNELGHCLFLHLIHPICRVFAGWRRNYYFFLGILLSWPFVV